VKAYDLRSSGDMKFMVKDITCLLIKIGISVVFVMFNLVDISFLTTS